MKNKGKSKKNALAQGQKKGKARPVNKNIEFLVKFFIIFAVLQAIITVAPLGALNEWIAGVEAGMLSLEREGNSLDGGNANYVISNSCTGLVSGSILAAIVFALKKPELKKKIAVFLVGAAALFAVNLVRVYFVVLGGLKFGFEFGEILHTVSWFVMSGFIIALWYYLTKRWAGVKDFSELL